MHQRLGAEVLRCLRAAQNEDLPSLKRWQLANLLFDLRMNRRLQMGCGDVATREEWNAAELRLEAEIRTRPAPAPRRPKAVAD
jgi:hypothetical protein